jgi:hypothetical protein
MTEDLVSAAASTAIPKKLPIIRKGGSNEARRPASIPEKFWDSDNQELRADALLKSYLELERKYSTGETSPVPATADDYEIEVVHELLESDPEVNKLMHEAGFTQQQAQLVYDLAAERLLPMINEVASIFEAERQTEKLIQHFGGEARWRQVAQQISSWGKAKLPDEIFQTLSTTYDGILTIYRMMVAGEPKLQVGATSEPSTQSESEIKQLMKDPRYWRDQDPTTVKRVRDGFRKLYND